MKILYVTDQIFRSSGVSVFCSELCDRLVERGHCVKLALQRPNFKEPYPIKHNEVLTSIKEVVKTFEHDAWDVVHINGIWNPPYRRIVKLATKYQVPIVWSIHGSLRPWALKHKWLKKALALRLYQLRDLKKASLIHVTATAEADDIPRLGLRMKVFVVPLGVDIKNDVESVRREKQSIVEKRILSLSRIHPVKAIDNLVRAWACLKKTMPEIARGWKVEVAGECCYPGYLDELKRLCSDLQVSEDVVFRGPIYGKEKERAYTTAKIFVLPSYSENFGSVVVESLSFGTPVITTKGTPWQLCEDNGCGWWIDVGVPPLVDALKRAMSMDDAELLSMGMNGRRWMEKDYSWDAIAEKMMGAYSRLVEGGDVSFGL